MEKSPFKTPPKASRKSSDRKKNEVRAGFYIRVSTEEQAENPEGSIRNQEERLNWALQMRSTDHLPWKKEDVYCDAGRSGKNMNRAELKRLIKDIESGRINMLMVSELSRLTRSNKDFSELWEFLQANKCGFMSLRENFDTSSAAGEMMLYQIANFAQFERKQTSERVSANFEARAKRGLWNGGVLPLGYEPDPDNRGGLRIVEEEARTVHAIFHAIITRRSVVEAARWLNENGYRYRVDHKHSGRPRLRHFTYDNVYRLIRLKAYIGVRSYKDKNGWQEVEANWKPIIDPKTFAEVQKIADSGWRAKVGRGDRMPYLLAGRIFCEQCGQPMIGMSAYGQQKKKIGYYAHSSQIRKERTLNEKAPRCDPYRVSAARAEERVWSEAIGVIRGTARTKIFEGIGNLSGSTYGDVLKRKELDLESATVKLSGLVHRIAELPVGVPAEPFYEEMKKLNETKGRLEADLKELSRKTDSLGLVTFARYEKLLERLKTLMPESGEVPFDVKKRIIHALIDRVVVTKNGGRAEFYAGLDQVKAGEAIASPADSLDKKKMVTSSTFNLSGGP